MKAQTKFTTQVEQLNEFPSQKVLILPGLTSRALSPGNPPPCHTLDRSAHDKRYCTMTVWHLYASGRRGSLPHTCTCRGASGTEDEGTARKSRCEPHGHTAHDRTNTPLSLAQSEPEILPADHRAASQEATGCERKSFTSQKEKLS